MKTLRANGGLRLDRGLLLACGIVLALTVLYPTARLIPQAIQHGQFGTVFSGEGWAALRNTVLIAFVSVLTSGIVGTSLAIVLARYAFPGRNVLAALAYLPFTLPPLVGVLSFYYLIGRDGLFPRLLERLTGLPALSLHGPSAIVLIHTYSFFVFFYAMVAAALESMDTTLLDAARTLGATRMRVFARVVLPLLQPALMGASLLTFMSSVASFSAPYFFGQDFPMLSVRIVHERSQFHNDAATALTVTLAAISLSGLVLFRSRRIASGASSKGVRIPLRGRTARLLMPAALWAFMAVLLLPHLTLAWLSFVDHHAWQTQLLPTAFTLDNYAQLVRDPRAFLPIRNSLWMSALAALAVLAVGLPSAYLFARKRPGGRLIYALTMLPWALPGTVIAMNLIAVFNDPWLPIQSTLWILPLAYFIRGLPLLARMAGAAIESFDTTLIEAGRTLGAPRTYCMLHIAAPLLAPALIAATALVFVTGLSDFVTSILLYRPDNMPIAVKINMEWRGAVGVAFAYSALLMILATATFIASRRFAARYVSGR